MARAVGGILVVLSVLAFLGAGITGYASDALFESDEFAERATAALDDEAVRDEVATRVTDDLVLGAEADLVAVRPLIEGLVSEIAGVSVFQGLFRSAVADFHRTLFEEDADTATLSLLDIGTVIRGTLEAVRPQLAKQIGGGSDAEVLELEVPPVVADLTRVAKDIKVLNWILLAISLGLAGLALWRAPDRRRMTVSLATALAIGSAVCAIGLGLARALVLADVGAGEAQDALGATWDAFFGDLRNQFLLYAGIGAVVAAAASSLLRPVDLGAPVRAAWDRLVTVPESPIGRAARGAGLLLVGVLIVIRPWTVLEIIAIAVGLYLAYAGVSELMRLTMSGEEAGPERKRQGRRALSAAVVAGVVILISGSAFVALGGTREEPLTIETEGCNGSDALCDRQLNEVAFPATHNAMSASTNPGWLFAQQDAGIADQLHDGIRALLIDAHYGQRTEDGAVKTDLSDIGPGERETYEDELGEKALDAALRIRDRVVDSPTEGDPGVFLCHRFCELGAISIEQAFGDVRDFLAANASEVLVVVVEDYVDPADVEAAAEKTGLVDYIYTGPLDPVPTLTEVIESGGRAIFMVENDPGDVSWYHAAYESLVQETPYSFKKPRDLTDPAQLPASCEPNRGPEDAPFFLLNHWVDTSPAPRPSNARKVNADKPLSARIADCEEIREHAVNLVAVDFYREGDLFEVVDRLNAERGE